MTANNSNSRPGTPREKQPVRPPKRSLTPWVLLLPIALLAGGWWMMNREPDEPKAPPVDNVVTAPTPRPEPTVKPTAAKPAPGGDLLKVTVFMPDDNGTLRRRTVTEPDLKITELPTPPSTYYKVVAARAVALLLKQSPQDFPAGTRLISLKQANGSNIVQANFNDKFAQPDFWQGSTQTQMTVYSIVNTLAAVDNPEKKVRVQFLIEGKPVDILGELDTAEPFEPDMTLVAKG
ncbi:MAG TPA: GerMN domain-containing protein [Abditibacteriaceae bacterium]|nr:GerMN domain-containing protein [Abditibacteriaceae bacterium]